PGPRARPRLPGRQAEGLGTAVRFGRFEGTTSRRDRMYVAITTIAGKRDMPPPKLISLPEAVRRYTWDGMQYASGAALPIGSDAVVFGRELLRQDRKDLHTIFHCNSQQLNLLAGAGAATKAECGFTGLEVFGFANGLRRAVESGHLALEDYSNLAMPLRLLGGALNWPFVPATVNIGS